jgi:hypothetical protein
MIWYALIIPILIVWLGWYFFRNKIVWWELFIPIASSVLFILVSYYTMKSITLHDVEYNGYVVVKAQRFEYWSSWVDKTCSYTTTCCCDSKGQNCQTQVHYYDCSYCDENKPYWVMYDSGGNKIHITEEYYKKLLKKWGAKEEFVDMNRKIHKRGRCGVDGDAYMITWKGEIETSETTTYEVSFSNILKSNHSAFNYPNITKEEAKLKGLFEYPELKGVYQKSVLGYDSKKLEQYMSHLNGYYGLAKKIRIYTLFYRNKHIDIAFEQEAYWDGGNQNELIVCISLDDNDKIQWVKAFSWCDNKRVVIDIMGDILKLGKVDPESFYNIYLNAIQDNWHYKSFKDFNYLSFEPTIGQLIFVYIMTLVISVGCVWYAIKNEYEHEG